MRKGEGDPDLPLGTIFRCTMPFVLTMIASLFVLVAVPRLSTWLARL